MKDSELKNDMIRFLVSDCRIRVYEAGETCDDCDYRPECQEVYLTSTPRKGQKKRVKKEYKNKIKLDIVSI